MRRYNARFAYMTPGEKMTKKLTIPKQWFRGAEYKKTKKAQVFGAVMTNGTSWATAVEPPFTSEKFCRLVSKLAPALKRAFPKRSTFTILIDNEKVMHTREAKAELAKHGIKALPQWPPHSPDLNPQENVWPGVEKRMRREAPKGSESLEAFTKRCVAYLKGLAKESCKNYIKSMPSRIEDCLTKKGGMGRR